VERLLILLSHLAESAKMRIESLRQAAPCSFWRAPFSRGNFGALRNTFNMPYDNGYGLLPEIKRIALHVLTL